MLKVKEGDQVQKDTVLVEWDPFSIPILTEIAGMIRFADLVENVTFEEKVDENTGTSRKVIIESKDGSLRPRIEIRDPHTGHIRKLENGIEGRYYLPAGCNISVQHDQVVQAGDAIAKVTREAQKTKDITVVSPAWPSSSKRASPRTPRWWPLTAT